MKNYWENVLNDKKHVEKKKQININNYLEGNIGLESYFYNQSPIDEQNYSSEVLSDVLKENPDEIPENINSPKDVPGGVPQDPTKMDDEANASDENPVDGETEMDASAGDTGSDTSDGNKEAEEDKPEYQLNKNEFATELGMKFLSKLFVDLSISVELSIKKLQSQPKLGKRVKELEELKSIIDDTTELIAITNIWETQTKYYLYLDRYREILKGCGINVSVSDLEKK